jgi:hypothetical protein
MPRSGLLGPWPLTTSTINSVIIRKSPGAYALSGTRNGAFYIDYVGRSDEDVAGGLRQHVGRYSQFKADYFRSPKAAFEKECELFHDFDPADNTAHPARPTNTRWKCPQCKVFG